MYPFSLCNRLITLLSSNLSVFNWFAIAKYSSLVATVEPRVILSSNWDIKDDLSAFAEWASKAKLIQSFLYDFKSSHLFGHK